MYRGKQSGSYNYMPLRRHSLTLRATVVNLVFRVPPTSFVPNHSGVNKAGAEMEWINHTMSDKKVKDPRALSTEESLKQAHTHDVVVTK